jgi:hypothetical protein
MRIPFLQSKSSASPKDELTILLPSKGRPALLKSLLGYYNQAKLPYKIIVLLSGDA